MSEWRSIKSFRGKTSEFGGPYVDLWLQIYASPRSFGMSDAFRVVECWRKDGKWFHLQDGKAEELYGDYVTHWMPTPKAPRSRRRL